MTKFLATWTLHNSEYRVSGWINISRGYCHRIMTSQGKRLMNLGSVDPQTRRKLVRGRLVDNVISGKEWIHVREDSRIGFGAQYVAVQQGVVIINVPHPPSTTRQRY